MTTLARIAPDTLQLTPGMALDAAGASALRPTLESVALARAPRVVLDLSRVEMMDGSGIGAIAFLRKRLLAAGQAMEVVGAHGQPLALLRSLGLATVFGLEETRRPFWAGLFRPLPGTGWGARA